MELRKNELTAISDRAFFENPPAGCESPSDLQRWAQFRQRYDVAQRLGARFDFPLHLDFELNAACNMRCSFCVHGEQTVKQNFLPRELYRKALEEGEAHGLVSIKFNYINEPLLSSDLAECVALAREHGVLNTYFATNGLLLSRERARELIEAKLSKVMISLDATTKATFSLMRRSSKFDTIVANIRGLLQLRKEMGVTWPKVRVNFLRTSQNIQEAKDFADTWVGLADAVGFQTQVAVPGVDDDLFRGDEVTVSDFKCSFPFKQIVVDNTGALLPCCTFSGRLLPLGNLQTTTIKSAWDSATMRELQSLHQRGRGRENPVCDHCIGGH